MVDIDDAKLNFEKMGFEIYNITPYKAPINDPNEIARLNAELKSAHEPKLTAALKYLLSEQQDGQYAGISATKTFEEFRNLPGKRRPFILGDFSSKNQECYLRFIARQLKSENHPLKDAGRISFFVNDGPLEKQIKEYIIKAGSYPELPKGVTLGSLGELRINPPFFIETEDKSLETAYANLAKAIRDLGYNLKDL